MCPIDTTALYEDVSTLDRPAVEALATEAFILAVQHIMAKLGIPDGDLSSHMLPDGNAAERLLCKYIEAEIDRKLGKDDEDPDHDVCTECGIIFARVTGCCSTPAVSRTTTLKDRP